METLEQHVAFCTAAVFDDEYPEQLESLDRSHLYSYAYELGRMFSGVSSVLFIAENDCASLVSAHYMSESMVCDHHKRVRYIVLERDAWDKPSRSMDHIRVRSPFKEQLWVIVGSPHWTLSAANAMLPEVERIPPVEDIPSAVLICGYTYRNLELAHLCGQTEIIASARLN